MSEHVLIDPRDGITRIRLRRPERKNALTTAMYGAIAEAITAAERDPAIRVITLTGDGGTFTAGNDIGDFAKVAQGGKIDAPLRFLEVLSAATKPVVAGVEGVAIGVGTTMLLHCDLVYASETARFKTPFVDLGLVPEGASSVLLPALLGWQRAAQLLLLGDELDARAAHAAGLVNGVVAAGAVDATVEEIAGRLAARAPGALRASKALMRRGRQAQVEAALAEEGREFLARLTAPEALEAFAAFMQKRRPDFSRF